MRSLSRPAVLAAATAFGLLSPAEPASAQHASAQQWTLDAQHFNGPRIWPLSTGHGVTVAVVDTGVDAHHPDLAGRILPGADFTGTAADGRIDTSSNAHGTSVAGIIAGTGTGQNGVAGLAPAATILPVRISTDLASNPATLAQGIDYAVKQGATVINISECAAILNPQVRAATDEAIQHDIVVVAAAGNNGLDGNPPQYPAALPGVIAVAATDNSGALWPKNESGTYLGLAAPGVDIYTTGPQGTRTKTTGTSFAAPQVAGAAALLRARYPTETAAQIIQRLTITAHHPTGTLRDTRSGYGLIDPYRALTLPAPPAAATNPLLQALPAPAHPQSPASRSPISGILIAIVVAVAAIAAAMVTALLIKRRRHVSTARR